MTMQLARRGFLGGLAGLLAGGWKAAPVAAPKAIKTIATQRSVDVAFTTYDSEFASAGAKIGQTMRIRLPNDFMVR
jgi:hypothetical protein